MDNQEKRADARRNRAILLEAASALLSETSGNLRIEDLAQRTGLGMGTIYRNLGDRDRIIELVILDCNVRALAELKEIPIHGDPLKVVESAARLIVRHSFGNLWNPQLIQNVSERLPELRVTIDEFTDRISTIIVRAQDAGVLRSDVKPRDVMELVARIVRPIFLDERTDGEQRAVLDSMLQVVLDGLKVRNNPA